MKLLSLDLLHVFSPPLAQVDMDPLTAALQSRGMVLMVLVVLVLLSIASWVVVGSRAWALRNLRREPQNPKTPFEHSVKFIRELY